MHQTSTPDSSTSSKNKQTASQRVVGPRETTLDFIRQFARSCQALPCSAPQMAIVNLN